MSRSPREYPKLAAWMIACATIALTSVAVVARQDAPVKNSSAPSEHSRTKAFSTPVAAAAALYAAARSGDENELLIILGPGAKSLVNSTDDPNERREQRKAIANKYQQMHRLVKEADDRMVLYLGAENWRVPIPIVEYQGKWYFDAGGPTSNQLSLSQPELPRPSLWEPFHIELSASGGTEPYHWRAADGSLPHGVHLSDRGELTGSLEEPGPFRLSVLVRDNSSPPKESQQVYVLRAKVPLTIDWKRKTLVSGQRIDGSIKVSNHTGRSLDLTFVVLAVNDIGRATAIGYQHFPLEKDTRDMELPFGDTLSPGDYVVHVDVVGEEHISKQIFRARLVAERKSITQGP